MKRFILVGVASALLLGGIAPAAVQAGTIAYDIQNYPADQGGHTLSGLIITDGKIGALASSDILSWTVIIDGSIMHSGGAGTAFITGDVEASGTQITMAQPPLPKPPLGSNENQLELGSANPTFLLIWDRETFNDHSIVTHDAALGLWGTTPTTLGGTDPWVIAENPEPASLTLLGIGGVALLGYGWRRRRRTAM